jgi:tRNA(Ile)-lysidine synthase
MNLIRGAGPDGLGGIKPIRPMFSATTEMPETLGVSGVSATAKRNETDMQDSSKAGAAPFLPFAPGPFLLIRPLLTWARRHDTESYCRDRGAEYRYDSMNEDLSFTRVRIRKLLLPMLEEFNPKIVETLANTAKLLRERTLTSSEACPSTDGLLADELPVSELKKRESAELYELLRAWLKQKRGDLRQLEMKHIEAIGRLLSSRKSGRTVELPGRVAVIRRGGHLVYTDLKVEKSPSEN